MKEERDNQNPWDKWGPYVSDRAWGTVREDYSENGDAWTYFPFDHSHKRAYRWGEDGIAGLCDRYQLLVFSWAFWNGKDPILKERYFGLSSDQGNHGEDVKEYYYYLDATPTHSYMKFLYKYPQKAFPYEKIREENQKREAKQLEYELIDTGVFDEDEYFDIFIEYAKKTSEDLCIKIEIHNRCAKDAEIHVIPQLLFRNRWSWSQEEQQKPMIRLNNSDNSHLCMELDDSKSRPLSNLPFKYELGKRYFYGPVNGNSYFTNNETNKKAIWGVSNTDPYTKDGFHRKIIYNEESVNPDQTGTKACFHYSFNIKGHEKQELFFRFCDQPLQKPFHKIEKIFHKRKQEADLFYQNIHSKTMNDDEKNIQRQALAGLIWSKQIYLFDVGQWLEGDDQSSPPSQARKMIRNHHWRHLNSMRIFSMPDKWEYPWFAAWDLAFHCLGFLLIDIEFAKNQLWQLLFDQFIHPNGQIPAYEWEFSDVNPPIQAWVALEIYHYEGKTLKKYDHNFLEKCFHKLLLNFAWWVNKIDIKGNNVFEGGFLGLDNITVIDRSKKMPEGAMLDQTDGSGWMAMFCLNMMRIALILSEINPNYEDMATKFFEHYVYIGAAMRKGYWRNYDTWDEKDGWFYSTIQYPDNRKIQLKIRSLVGIIPFFAFDVLTEKELKKYPNFSINFHWFLKNRPELMKKSIKIVDKEKYVFGFMTEDEMKRFFQYIWDPNEFRSSFGLRSVSKYHESNPFSFGEHCIQYEPGESLEKIKGGNSNWRGPIWFPTSYLFIRTCEELSKVYKDSFYIQVLNESPVTLSEIAHGFADRLIQIFAKSNKGRAVFEPYKKLQEDPHFKDYLLFFEHYHGDSGRGLGASHQTGWSALIAKILQDYR